MSTFVPLLDTEQVQRLPAGAREVVEYRKSGLSLNHIQGCPLDCAYCIRHTYGLWDQRQPRALMPDAEAVERLVSHRYFQAHVTPVQILNRATDPFLPAVRPHTLAVLADLDGRGLRNHVLVITRHQMKPSDAGRLNQLVNLKVTLLFTYSGIADKRIEPYPSQVAADSLKLMSGPGRRRYRTILYWRPLVLAAFAGSASLFRKTSCAVSYAHHLPDYNGHHGIRELYDIFPVSQVGLCRNAHQAPSADQIYQLARALPETEGIQVVDISERAAVVSGLGDEQPRYCLQHALGFQMHDVRHPHHVHRHGRADTGWKDAPRDD